jgi:uncharacterized protein (TIGR00255 family)
MIKSMTGYGKGEASNGGGRLAVEIRSVNHRYGEVYVKLPRNLMIFEKDVRKIVSERLRRGKIEVFIQHEPGAEGSPLAVNMNLAKAYVEAFSNMKKTLGLAGEVTLPMIAAQKDVLTADDSHAVDASLGEALLAAVRNALENIEAMRKKEGEALLADLRKRAESVSALAAMVAQRAPLVVRDYRERLKERLAQLTADSTVSEERLTQEVAIMADRCDITEELVRLDSHLKQFDAALSLGEPVGRKLDFLLQEVSREVNTMGSKANDSEITRHVVELKTEIEKIREQVQNIE